MNDAAAGSGGDALFCIKMRASRAGEHTSGAERIAPGPELPHIAADLARRALSHPKGAPDFINIKADAATDIERLEALPVSTCETADAESGLETARRLLREAGVARADEIMELFPECHSMRGAMIVDAATLERLEPDRERGVRATRMDMAGAYSAAGRKNHFAEALVLATKVANAPGIAAEVCISDDPDYVTGYVASKTLGYRRITRIKEPGDPRGGRIFIYNGPRGEVAAAIRYLEEKTVVVEEPPAAPPAGSAAPPAGRAPLDAVLADELAAIDREGLRRKCTGEYPAGTVVLASNDYLGLAKDPRVAEAAAKAARDFGGGTGGSRLATGSIALHRRLEEHIAAFKGAEAAVLFSTGYMANLATICALAGKDDLIASDSLNHASIIDGCRLSGARIAIYPHGDLDALDRILAAARGYRRVLAVSDGVFSMDGDLLDLPRFTETCRRRGAVSIVDEAHATGVCGATGRGLKEHFGCGAPDVEVGTLSKALGSSGGFVCGSRVLAAYLRNKARPFIFSTAPCPASAGAAEEALSILENEPRLVERLRSNVRAFRAALAGNGFEIAPRCDSAIVPVAAGSEARAVEISKRLLERGFAAPAIRYPTVARGAARLRFAISAAHDAATLAAAARALRDAAR